MAPETITNAFTGKTSSCGLIRVTGSEVAANDALMRRRRYGPT